MKDAITFAGKVRTALLSPNPWNTNIVSPENEKRIEESIKKHGMFKSIIVRELEDGSYQILGGQHRWEVCTRLGVTEVPIISLGQISELRAKEIGLIDNARYGNDDTIGLSQLLQEIGIEDINMVLPYTEVELQSILDATSIDLDSLGLSPDIDADAKLPEPKPAPDHQVMRFKVPVEDVAWVQAKIEKTMKQQNFTQEDSLANAGNALVHLLKKD